MSPARSGLPEKMVAIHQRLAALGVDHAFGGALALAWCTQRARGTNDLDLNIFLPPSDADVALDALPDEVVASDAERAQLERDGQARLWWDTTPVDVFLSTTTFHEQVATRIRREPFAGHDLPFLACDDLAVFKAFFDRPRDWADLEEMLAAGSLDVARVLGVLVQHLGADDHRVARLATLSASSR